MNDALAMTKAEMASARKDEKETNDHYTTELDKQIQVLADEKAHVKKGETNAVNMMGVLSK